MLFTIISFDSMIDRCAVGHFISFIAIVFDDEPIEAGDIVVFIIMNIFGAVVLVFLCLCVVMMILRLCRLEIPVVYVDLRHDVFLLLLYEILADLL